MFGMYNIKELDVDALEAGKSQIHLIDVRTEGEFILGNVPGSVNIPHTQVTSRIKEFEGKRDIIVFCASGKRAGIAKDTLEKAGIRNVINAGTWQNVNKLIN